MVASRPTVSICIPAYNEEQALPGVLAELCAWCAERPEVEIVVVDDGSADGTSIVAAPFPRVRVLRHRINRGNGAAIKTAIRAATGEIVVVMDADGQHPVEYIDRLVGLTAEADIVIGARTGDSDAALYRTLGNRIMQALASYLVRRPVPDVSSGFRAFRRELLLPLLPLFPDDMSYTPASLLYLAADARVIAFEPVIARRRQGGESKINALHDGIDHLRFIVRMVLLFHPSRVFLPVAATTFLLGVFWTINRMIVVGQGVPGAAQVLFITSMFVVLMSLLAEQNADFRKLMGAVLEQRGRPGNDSNVEVR